MGVRFISVVDRYDSFETDGSASSLLIPLKNLINSFYSRDQSKKVSLAVHAKQLAGEHIPSMIPYGYRKSTTQEYRFEPDPETAPIVKRIYAQFLCGTGARPIMRQLNEEGIPSPGKLRYLRGQTNRACYSDCLWTQQVIKQIWLYPLQPDISDWFGIARRLAFRNHPGWAGVSWRTIMQLENLSRTGTYLMNVYEIFKVQQAERESLLSNRLICSSHPIAGGKSCFRTGSKRFFDFFLETCPTPVCCIFG